MTWLSKRRRDSASVPSRQVEQVVFRRDTMFLNSNGVLDFVSFSPPSLSGYTGIQMSRAKYEAAGCPKRLVMTVTTEDVARTETRRVSAEGANA